MTTNTHRARVRLLDCRCGAGHTSVSRFRVEFRRSCAAHPTNRRVGAREAVDARFDPTLPIG